LSIYFDPASVGGMMDVSLDDVKSWLSMMDVVLLNEEESMYITGVANPEHAIDILLESCSAAVIKRGAQGAIGKARGSILVSVEAFPTTVVDTTGAGDSFAAGFIAHYALTKNMQHGLESGAKVAAKCVETVGARPRVGTVI
jgi:sugar/nucleoside kinase (ribokinase family)